jgi:hypothetical protein
LIRRLARVFEFASRRLRDVKIGSDEELILDRLAPFGSPSLFGKSGGDEGLILDRPLPFGLPFARPAFA